MVNALFRIVQIMVEKATFVGFRGADWGDRPPVDPILSKPVGLHFATHVEGR